MNQILVRLLREYSFKLAPPGQPFTLASGAKSPYFIDVKQTALRPDGIEVIAGHFLDRIRDWYAEHQSPLDAVAGVALGGCPLATGVSLLGAMDEHAPIHLSALYVRKEAKDHGTAKMVEGHVWAGMKAVLVEDVVTTGGSSLKAIEALKSVGVRVPLVLAVVDREEGAKKAFAEAGVEFDPLLLVSDLT